MKFQTYLIKYGEIGIKGKNRYMFEDALVRQIKHSLKDLDGLFHTYKAQGRVYVDCDGDYDGDEVVEALKRVFGIVGICPVVRVEDKGFEELKKDVIAYMDEVYPDKNITFKVESRRAKKTYPKKSMEINYDLGEAILYAFPEIRRCTPPGCTASCRGKRRDLYLFRDHSGTWRYADRDQWNRDASAFRWNRQSGCRLYDLQTWRRTGGNLFPCTAVHQREGQTEGSGSCKAGFQIYRTDQAACSQFYRYPALYL